MITVKEAYVNAKTIFPKYTLVECIDIGNAFAFYFSDDIDPVPGIPYVTVNKKTKDIEMLSIPPLKNLKIIQSGKQIPIKRFIK